ncbi:MAG: hypothetical protein R2788_17800 [Saprospiraceae bacterium]
MSRKFLYIIIYASGPKKLLRFEAAGCSAQKGSRGEGSATFSPLKSLGRYESLCRIHFGMNSGQRLFRRLQKDQLILPRIL